MCTTTRQHYQCPEGGREIVCYRVMRDVWNSIDCDLNQVAAMRRFGRPDRECVIMCVMAFVIWVINTNVRIQREKKKVPASVKRKIVESSTRT